MNHIAIDRFLNDLKELGYTPVLKIVDSNQQFVILSQFFIEFGRFKGRTIDLGIPALSDYPRMMPSSLQIMAVPPLLAKQNIPTKLNVIDSPIGPDWQYWSFRFTNYPEDPTKQLMNQINTIFRDI